MLVKCRNYNVSMNIDSIQESGFNRNDKDNKTWYAPLCKIYIKCKNFIGYAYTKAISQDMKLFVGSVPYNA